MGKLLPSRWGLKTLDALLVIVLLVFVIRLVAPASGLAADIHIVGAWLAIGVNWISGILQQLLNAA